MSYNNLLLELQAHIASFFATHNDVRFVYHNSKHTEMVVAAANQIGNHFQLNERDFFVVITAAHFHDTGYFVDAKNHEEKSSELATKFLTDKDVAEDVINDVRNCIMATKMPQSPTGLLQQIVCDADLFHLGTDDFTDINKSLHQEVEALKGLRISKADWRTSTIALLENHHYHTDYAQMLLNDKKAKNLKKLKNKQAEQAEPKENKEAKTLVEQPIINSVPEAKKDKNRPERGIETMFRITSNNNQRLSDMADNKAHIMITVNSIILSAIISLLLGKVTKEAQQHLALPTYLILSISVMAIIFSILATRPSLPKGLFSKQDIADKKVNLLFFGNFYKMSLGDYTDGMLQVMADKDFLYGSLIKDVYSQGIVLGRKYRLLRISYNIFMFGLVASVLAFVIATIIHEQ